jgi:DNA-binding response OmpR family regulator
MGISKILIVDDEPGFTEMVKLNLEATGRYNVRIENDSKKAEFAALEYLPDIILLDIIMPDMEGPDIVDEIRKHNIIKKVPIVFLTATVTHDEVKAQGGCIGGHKFLAKPTTVKELIDCIEHHLRTKDNS